MIYFDNTQDEQRVSIPRSIASETAPTGPYRPGDGIYINDNTISVTGRQETLVSGVNIKTINGESLLGEGNIVISGGTGGTSYSAGTNIDITNDTISVTGITSYTGVTEEEITTALGAAPLTGITSGDVTTALGYTPISGIPDNYVTDTELQNAVSGKQDTLISGTNIHTINGQDILGGGDMVITGGQAVVAGNNIDIENGVVSVTGITSYTGITSGDVVTALGFEPASENDMSNKQDTLVSGENIKTINGQSILGEGNIVISGGTGGTSYSAGTNIDITNDTISVTGITSYTGITKNDVTTALGFTPVSSTTITEIWSGTQAEYANIYPKLSTTLYLVHE